MRSSPRVSVLIPAYNGARFLRDALDSVVAQEGVDFEIILADDASTDGTAEIVRDYPRVRYLLNRVNLGLSGNFNRCLEEARGTFLSVFCQDDRMEPGNLARKSDLLERNEEVGLVASNARTVEVGDPSRSKLWNVDLPGDRIYSGTWFLRRLLLGDNPIALSGAMFRGDLARKLGGFDARFPQALDWHLWMRLCLSARVAYLASPLVTYRNHPGTVTRRHGAFMNIADVYRAKIDVLRSWRARLPGGEILEDQFRTHFGKGLLASSVKAWWRKDDTLALALFKLAWEAAPRLEFLPKAVLLGLVQGLLHRRLYPGRI